MARVLYENGVKIGEVEEWKQREDAAVYKTFLGKTALVAPANTECTFTSPKPVKRKSALTIIEDKRSELTLTVVRVTNGTQIIAKILEQRDIIRSSK